MIAPKFGLIGCGNQGISHAKALIDLDKEGVLSFVGVCDLNTTKIEKILLEKECHTVKTYRDYEAFLEDVKLDYVILALPNKLYRDVVLVCLRKNIKIIKEKPFAMNANEAIGFINKAFEFKGLIKIAQQRQYHPFFMKAKKWLPQVGSIKFVDYKFTLNDTKKSWYWNKEEGGGSWLGLGWHACYIIYDFLGSPQIVRNRYLTSNKRNFAYETDDTSVLECIYENGAIAKALLSVVSTDKNEDLLIMGDKGNISLNRKRVVLYDNDGVEIESDDNNYDWNDVYKKQIVEFITDCENIPLHTTKELIKSFDILSMLEAGKISAKNSGMPIMLSSLQQLNTLNY